MARVSAPVMSVLQALNPINDTVVIGEAFLNHLDDALTGHVLFIDQPDSDKSQIPGRRFALDTPVG